MKINLFFFIGMQLFAENIYFETEYLKTIPISANNIFLFFYKCINAGASHFLYIDFPLISVRL